MATEEEFAEKYLHYCVHRSIEDFEAFEEMDHLVKDDPQAAWAVTTERNGSGEADIYRVHPDGTAMQRVTDDAAFDDQAALSPDGTKVAFVSSRVTHFTNIQIGFEDAKDPKPNRCGSFPRRSKQT